uniref:C2H2-type domain-containing protein n=1 Tax=Magallana gigas TaxID=29159 RepID=A0A8W8LUZ6_MAGGI
MKRLESSGHEKEPQIVTCAQSDSQSSAVCSQSSNWSQEEEALPLQEIQLADVNAAINIISQGQISPLRSRLGTDLVDVKERTLRYYKRKAEETCTALLDAIAPHQGQRLKRIVLPSSESSDDDLFNVVGEMYHNIKDANLKCQLLSLIVHRCSKAELLTKFPEITKHQIDKARRHAFVYGPGSDVQLKASSQHRERINYAKLQHAVEFFSDPSFNEISSYTTRNLKLDSGNTLVIPDIVRTMIHSNLIKLYNAYCTSINFEPLSESTLYEVLNACSASKRKCLKGLDNIAVDGSSAFDSLSSLVDKLDEPQQWKKEMKEKLFNARLYLKTDYKLHIKREDECAFHCLQYALSDPKSSLLGVTCDHEHNQNCSRCYIFGEAVTEIREVIIKTPSEEQEDQNGSLVHKTFTHIMDYVKQDFFAVLSLLEHTLVTIKQHMPNITEAYLRSDNAGCYHCGQIWLSIPSLSERTGITVKRYDYSEAQSGKSYCDAKIAHMRSKMRIFSSEGHNICTATQMKEAIDSGAGVKGTCIAVVDVDVTKQEVTKHSWKGVSFISNIEFTSTGIKTWRAYRIGEGCFKDTESLQKLGQTQSATCLKIISDFNYPENHGKIHLKTPNTDDESGSHDRSDSISNDEEECENEPTEMNSKLFFCPEYGCVKSYQTFGKLNEHLLIGNHVFKKLSESSSDKTKKLWAETCNSVLTTTRPRVEHEPEASDSVDLPVRGWALKKEKRYSRFSQKVKDFLTDLFKKGEESGRKENPTAVALEMRNLVEDGRKKFSPCEWLQPSQISSFFSRLAVNSSQANVICAEKLGLDDSDLLSVLSELQNAEVFQNIT